MANHSPPRRGGRLTGQPCRRCGCTLEKSHSGYCAACTGRVRCPICGRAWGWRKCCPSCAALIRHSCHREGTAELPPEEMPRHEARIADYARRAGLRLPLFAARQRPPAAPPLRAGRPAAAPGGTVMPRLSSSGAG